MNETFFDGRLIVKVGDLTEEKVDAIVNAANRSLLGGSGVDGAIHAKGGPEILRECRVIRKNEYPDGLPTGAAVITTAGELPSKHVIHTVGPVYGHNDGRDAELLAACYTNSMALAVENALRTIAFPSVSTGAYAFPKHLAAPIVAAALRPVVEDDQGQLQVSLVFFSDQDARVFLQHSAL